MTHRVTTTSKSFDPLSFEVFELDPLCVQLATLTLHVQES